ncbi:hypothetical protein BC830DRAFT_562341 [Chytriomyces sp. MP71]|nr:hypothetical protein BC830DRAFT_562341 [Chytriomyces sp. MP71]
MQIIKLLDSTGERVLDSVSAEYEDSFSLDSFADLISAHENANPPGTRAFIIARVQTWDHKHPDRAYYSYYDAFQLNKIMFQTQVYFDKRLIHRLHVLNPLTNTDIIGDVQYFIIRTVQSEKISSLKRPKVKFIEPERSISEDQSCMTKPKPKAYFTGGLKVETNLHPSQALLGDLPPPSPSVQAIEKGDRTSWTIASPIVGHMHEEDPLEVPKNPTNTPASHLIVTPVANFLRRISGVPPQKSKSAPTSRQVSPTALGSIATDQSGQINALISPAKFHPQMNYSGLKPHAALRTAGGMENLRIHIPEGNITRFGRTLTPDELHFPRTHKNRRRHLSYANAVTAAGSPASVEDWMLLVSEDGNRDLDGEDVDHDAVDEFGARTAHVAAHDDADFSTHDAVLFATDSDFLESSAIRRLFKLNACVAQDAVLFEMTPVTTEPPQSPTASTRYDEDEHETPCAWCFPSEDELRKYRPVSRLLHKYKCYMMMVVFIVMVSLFIVYTMRITSQQIASQSQAQTPAVIQYTRIIPLKTTVAINSQSLPGGSNLHP